MGKVYERIDGRLRDFIDAQPMFFVATAPSGDGGRVNLSPKGMTGSFVVLDPLRVAYLDFHGSGVETIAHLRENGRITIMFCAFEGPPKIVRLHGHGRATSVDEPACAGLLDAFPRPPDLRGLRSVITVEVERVSDSCGYAVPLMTYEGDRDLLIRAHERRTEDDLAEYRRTRNRASIDGLPGFDRQPAPAHHPVRDQQPRQDQQSVPAKNPSGTGTGVEPANPTRPATGAGPAYP